MIKIPATYMLSILEAAENYDNAKIVIKTPNSYQVAEKFSGVVEALSGLEIKPDNFLLTDEQKANKNLHHWDKYQRILNKSGYPKRWIEEFAKWYHEAQKPNLLSYHILAIKVLLSLHIMKKERIISKEIALSKYNELKEIESPFWRFNGHEMRTAYALARAVTLDLNIKIEKGVL